MSIIIHFADRFGFRGTSRLCELFQAAAYDVWTRTQFSRTRPRLKIHETSITQNLVYEMNLLKQIFPIPELTIYEPIDEAANGDDLEIYITQENGIVYKYAVQAKIIYHSLKAKSKTRLDDGVYTQLKHVVGAKNQVDILLAYAKKRGAIPLYLLYNFVSGRIHSGNACGIDFDISQYGCSLVSADYLSRNLRDIKDGNLRSNIKFSEVHPTTAVPWFMLACCFPQYSLKETLQRLGLPRNYLVDKASVEQVRDDNIKWSLLGQDYTSDKIADTQNLNPNNLPIFNPKFRFFININGLQ